MLNLFPTPIAMYNIDRELTKEELEYITQQTQRPNEGNKSSSSRKVLNEEILLNIREFIQDKIDEYFTEVYSPKTNVKMKITQSWFNYTNPGEYHHKHNHANSFISAVFYPLCDEEKDRIYFYNPNSPMLVIDTDEYNIWNSQSWWFTTRPGDLIIFPSNLTHSVPTTQSEKTRISLALNTFPVGEIGSSDSLTSLTLKDIS